MPVVAGQRSTKIQMLLYTLLLAPIALVPAWLGIAGVIYAAVAIGLNLAFIGHAIAVLRERDVADKGAIAPPRRCSAFRCCICSAISPR